MKRRAIHRVLVIAVFGAAWGAATAFATAATAAPVLGDPCPNGDVRKAQGVGGLPDCIALEQVSPQLKHNQPARILYKNPNFGSLSWGNISPAGNRVLFRSSAGLGGTPGLQNVFGDVYVATRDSSGQGWVTDHTSPPVGIAGGWEGIPVPQAMSADLSHWYQIVSTRKQWAAGLGQVFHDGLDHGFQAVSPLLTPLSGTPEGESGQVTFRSRGTSADGSQLYFTGDTSVTYLPGDPTPVGAGSEKNTYVAALDPLGDPSLQLLARDRDGKVWGGQCGAGVGGNTNPERNLGSIAPDGSRVYFTTRPGQLAGPCDSVNKRRIMVREETPAGPVIAPLYESECDRVADPGPPEVPACGMALEGSVIPPGGNPVPNGDDIYQGASIEGDRVYFTTSRQLADSDVNGFDQFGFSSGCSAGGFFGPGGCDLYLYDAARPAGERLTQVTAAGSGRRALTVGAISGDGSHVYFNSGDVLTTEPGPGSTGTAVAGQSNLYVYDAEADELSFVARTAIAPGSPYPVPVLGPDPEALGIGGDGHLLLFTSTAALTDDDADGSFADVYRYDADAHTLLRISKAAPGGSESGGLPGVAVGLTLGGEFNNNHQNSPNYVGRGRWVSEDGGVVAFKTVDALLPDDSNGIMDSYVWREGQLFRLPGTADSTNGFGESGLHDRPHVSFDGDTVAFQTFEQLVARDGDTAIDVYVARAGGGFPEPEPVEPCVPDGSEGCQGSAGAPQGDLSPVSAVFSGRGNLTDANRPKPKPCRKGTRRVRRNGKARCVKKASRRGAKRKADNDRRAGE